MGQPRLLFNTELTVEYERHSNLSSSPTYKDGGNRPFPHPRQFLNGIVTRSVADYEKKLGRNPTEAELLSLFGKKLFKVRSVSSDMSATYLKLCAEQFPNAEHVVDKFHMMQYVYEAVLDVRSRLKKKLAGRLSKGKGKTDRGRKILYELELLKRSRHRLTQADDEWTASGRQAMEQLFAKHKELKAAYWLAQDFKKWYDLANRCKTSG